MSIVEKFMTMEYGPAPEDPREALAWLDRHGRRFGHFMNGDWQAPAAGTYFDTAGPSTGERIAGVGQWSAPGGGGTGKWSEEVFARWTCFKPQSAARLCHRPGPRGS